MLLYFKSEGLLILIYRKPVISLDKIDENIAAHHASADDLDNKTDDNKEDVVSPFEMINTVYV